MPFGTEVLPTYGTAGRVAGYILPSAIPEIPAISAFGGLALGAVAGAVSIAVTGKAVYDANIAESDLQKAQNIYEKSLQRLQAAQIVNTSGRSSTNNSSVPITWILRGDGLDCNGGGIYPNSNLYLEITQGVGQPSPTFESAPHPSCGQYQTKNIRMPDGSLLAYYLHPSATLTKAPTATPTGDKGYNGSNQDGRNKPSPLDYFRGIDAAYGGGRPVPSADRIGANRAALGLGKEVNTGKVATPVKSPTINPSPIGNPSVTPSPTPANPTSPSRSPSPSSPSSPTSPPTYDPNQNNDQKLGYLAALLGLVYGNTTSINQNTQPAQQQQNAKEGSCQAMNSPSCTSGLEGRIKNPLSDKLDAAQIARDAGQAYEVAQFSAIAENFTKVKNFLDNTIIDRAIGVANFAMNAHNALMLSNALGKTLAGVVDTAMNLTPFKFADATTGTPTTASRAFSQNVSALIVNLIGQEQYTELTDDWKVANRFYQGLTNTTNKVERLFAGQSKVQQKSGIDIANIGNALRANGIVNPNSYPPMAATKEANTPTELLTDVNTPLASIQAGVKNLNSVTKDVAGTVKQVTAIQKEFGKLADLTNKESKVRKSFRTQSANQAKVRAKFTLLQIKTIKATGKK